MTTIKQKAPIHCHGCRSNIRDNNRGFAFIEKIPAAHGGGWGIFCSPSCYRGWVQRIRTGERKT